MIKAATEMEKLQDLLKKENIPFETRPLRGNVQILYYGHGDKDRICDVIEDGYGSEKGLLEIMGLTDTEEAEQDVEGYLSAEQVFERIQKHWEGTT